MPLLTYSLANKYVSKYFKNIQYGKGLKQKMEVSQTVGDRVKEYSSIEDNSVVSIKV